MKRLFATLAVGIALTFGATLPTPAANAAPTHNETSLSLFTCAATRGGTGHSTMTVNHSHKIAAESTTDAFGNLAIDAYDCEGYVHAGLDGCVWRAYYVYDNKLDGSDLGIIGPVRISCFGF